MFPSRVKFWVPVSDPQPSQVNRKTTIPVRHLPVAAVSLGVSARRSEAVSLISRMSMDKEFLKVEGKSDVFNMHR